MTDTIHAFWKAISLAPKRILKKQAFAIHAPLKRVDPACNPKGASSDIPDLRRSDTRRDLGARTAGDRPRRDLGAKGACSPLAAMAIAMALAPLYASVVIDTGVGRSLPIEATVEIRPQAFKWLRYKLKTTLAAYAKGILVNERSGEPKLFASLYALGEVVSFVADQNRRRFLVGGYLGESCVIFDCLALRKSNYRPQGAHKRSARSDIVKDEILHFSVVLDHRLPVFLLGGQGLDGDEKQRPLGFLESMSREPEGLSNKEQTKQRSYGATDGNNGAPEGPVSRFPLGLKVALVTPLIAVGHWLARRGWYGSRYWGYLIFIAGCALVSGALVWLMM